MREYLNELESMGRELAAMGLDEKRAKHMLLNNLNSGPAARLAMRAYRAACTPPAVIAA